MRQNILMQKFICYFYEIRVFIVIGAMISLSSCAYKPYDLVMHNTGSEKARNVEIIMGKGSFSFGWVSPGQEKKHVLPSAPLMNELDTLWARGDGSEKYKSNLTLPQSLPTLKTKEWYEVVVMINDANEAEVKVLVCIPPYGPCK